MSEIDTSTAAVDDLISFIERNAQYEELDDVDKDAYRQAAETLGAIAAERDKLREANANLAKVAEDYRRRLNQLKETGK